MMEYVARVWFALFFSALAFAPRPLKMRGAFSRGPWLTSEPWNERVIRGLALGIAVIIWLDPLLATTGRQPILR